MNADRSCVDCGMLTPECLTNRERHYPWCRVDEQYRLRRLAGKPERCPFEDCGGDILNPEAEYCRWCEREFSQSATKGQP